MNKQEDERDPIKLVIEPKERDLDGISVRRVLPVAKCRMVGPFVFFDQMGPTVLPADHPLSVRPHPHIGLATLTWMIDGVIMHRDSLGYRQEIKQGEVNWMTAGRGVVHSERTPERLLGQPVPLFGLQIWMALPKTHEEIEPSFQHYTADCIPTFEKDGVRGSVVAGEIWGMTSPVAVYWETLYVDLTLQAGASITLGKEHEERAIYPLRGKIQINGRLFEPERMLVLEPGVDAEIRAVEETHFVVIGGAKMDGPRHMWWNFVSSDKARIEQAKQDWTNGRFDPVIDDEEVTPLPE